MRRSGAPGGGAGAAEAGTARRSGWGRGSGPRRARSDRVEPRGERARGADAAARAPDPQPGPWSGGWVRRMGPAALGKGAPCRCRVTGPGRAGVGVGAPRPLCRLAGPAGPPGPDSGPRKPRTPCHPSLPPTPRGAGRAEGRGGVGWAAERAHPRESDLSSHPACPKHRGPNVQGTPPGGRGAQGHRPTVEPSPPSADPGRGCGAAARAGAGKVVGMVHADIRRAPDIIADQPGVMAANSRPGSLLQQGCNPKGK